MCNVRTNIIHKLYLLRLIMTNYEYFQLENPNTNFRQNNLDTANTAKHVLCIIFFLKKTPQNVTILEQQ
ncbi:hypothetical protein RclHR1_04510018 [Rhizophagus clarus]|uniref:Uncharacterized protein n=1 Tax=Rhizophagus clarus TaxID=94130 RepID=A0A2Z6RI02_9GLOM|nr:hypothetical protein RclHR1_04510018 [Rhizophagus clarus]